MEKNNILQYESTVWKTADLLIASGIKQSDFPKFMMPFFALIMVESRFERMTDELRKEYEENELNIDDLFEEIRDQEQGYNKYLIEHNKTLSDICKNDTTFEIDFDSYLKGFDGETKDLLGIEKGNDEEKYLNISGICGQLKKKKILFSFAKAWSEIDLKPFNNSEITTLEEHIKRKWADISAETAGEQYTPDDVISLISEIITSKIDDKKGIVSIYDPTCGGGNMLFGVEDKIKDKLLKFTATFGQDWNDSLYALAKIESRFREDSNIEYGNTLTGTAFYDKSFDVVVANPPYGVDWKGYQQDIRRDKTGRFVALPAVSDGQLLFMQHIISKMVSNGKGVVVHNGSSLFSGDAGSGESTIRKWMFDTDIVEAIIQMPTDEFFNTPIITYLWVLNKKKPEMRKDKVMMINASAKFKLLKKSKGKKRKEIDAENQQLIVQTLLEYQETDFAKIFDKEYFYYNKQAIMLTNLDENGKSLEELLPIKIDRNGNKKRDKSIKLENLQKITQKDEDSDLLFDKFYITDFDEKFNTLKNYNTTVVREQLALFDYKEKDLKVYTENAIYWFDEDKETIIKEENGLLQELGCGKIIIKSTYKKATRTKEANIIITVELTPDYQKDYEIIPFSRDEKQNQKNITDFMAKYIFKPFEYLDNTVGVEINFNKIFYKPEILRPLDEIVCDLNEIDNELKQLESELKL